MLADGRLSSVDVNAFLRCPAEDRIRGVCLRVCAGHYLWREARGLWHIQNPSRSERILFSGTLRECESVLSEKSHPFGRSAS